MTLSTLNPLQKLFFLRIIMNRKIWKMCSHSQDNKDFHLYKYRFWPAAGLSIGKTMSSKIWRVLGPPKFGNPFTFIWRYSSKRPSTLLDYLMKLPYCLVNITRIWIQMHISLVQLLGCYLGRELFESIMIILESCRNLLVGIIYQILLYEKYGYM